MSKTEELYRKAKKIIPGGTQLLSKRPEMFLPGRWPAYYQKAKGCEVWDLDGRKYVDMSLMGIGSCILGYADAVVDAAVKRVVDKGTMSTLNVPEDVELGRELLQLHPWAQMVRYARSGGEAMSIAVRIARSKTRRDKVLFCGYHGWHDWYLSANLAEKRSLDGHLLPGLSPVGVPRNLKGTSFPFRYNDIDGFLKLIKKHGKNTAAIVMEPMRNDWPQKGFLETIRRLTKKEKIVLIFDEITAGWRLNCGGVHLLFKVKPDIAVFAKGISNGFPMAAIIGAKNVMEYAQDTFISSTYWTERIGPTAALATIKQFKKHRVQAHLMAMGEKIKTGWKELADKNGLNVSVSGMSPLAHFQFHDKDPLTLKTLFTQGMLENGFLATTGYYSSWAHKPRHVKAYLRAVDQVFAQIKRAVRTGKPGQFLRGPVCNAGFKRLA